MEVSKDQREYWRWQEYHRVLSDKSWDSKDVITAGVDVGSVGSKAAVMIDGQMYAWAITRTGSNSPDSAKKVMGMVLEDTRTAKTSPGCGGSACTGSTPW